MTRALVFALALLLPTLAAAQTYPMRPVHLVTPGTPGSTSDIMPRVLAELLTPALGKPVVVENKSGGSGLVSATAVLAAPADGYTLWLGTMGTLMINPHVLKSMPFDPMTAFVPVGLVASMPLVLVINPKVTPAANLREFIALAKSKPGFTYGSAGAGSSPAISAAMLAERAGVQFQHVPYRGYTPALQAVITGEITMMVPDVGIVRDKIEDGTYRALAVTSPQRSPLLPDVPTFKEQGYDIELALWYGIYVAAGTPREISDRLARELKAVMEQSVLKERWKALGLEPGDKFGPDFAAYHAAEHKRWAEIIPPLGIKPE